MTMNTLPALEELIATILDIETDLVTAESSRDNTENWDSLAQLSILSAVEDTYGVTLTTEQMLRANSVGALRALLVAQGVTG